MRYRVIYFLCLCYLALPLCIVSMHLTRCAPGYVVCIFFHCFVKFLVFEAAIYANKDVYISAATGINGRISCRTSGRQRGRAGQAAGSVH